MQLIFASQNLHKIEEIQTKLPQYKILGLDKILFPEELEETGETLLENARQKAWFVHKKTHQNCFADDTGLEVDALQGAPGVYSGRYAGEPKNDLNNLSFLLNNLQNETQRTARFKTVIVLIWDRKEYIFEGICEGIILTEKKGSGGFGYDSIFKPIGFTKSFAEMSIQEKNTISHRAMAVNELINFVNKI
jgi:XTP/dITP diphosphohydrolase